ncbi:MULTISPECIES: flavodoxin family protein [unclassified Clostridium]|uniref:flavodoxin family protein n=1 Tax=unclassified Clostridium TaxID=2614128 RepID=UPI000EE2C7B0|nr:MULTISPECIES: flavodoxin family protein [unclassified Clostridium]HCQ90202.1 NADPH-dependent FMN reductase [Clostridium sp.]
MNICVLMGSMRKNGNTEMLIRPFVEQLKSQDVEVQYIWLCDKHIEPCKSCFVCQDIDDKPGCPIKDEMEQIYKSVLEANCIVFATPIYSWSCTAPMKVVMDRLFCMNKFYGNTKKHYGLWENKKCAIIATCGYEIESGADLFEEVLKRLSIHSHLDYLGMLTVRDINGIIDFQTEEVIENAKDFALKIYNKCE